MLSNCLFVLLLMSLLSSPVSALENPLQSSMTRPFSPRYQHPIQLPTAAETTPRFELKQPLLVIKKSNHKRKRTAQLQLLNMWIDPDISRLFIPRLHNMGRLSLNLHYSLKRSPYLLLDYEGVTIKTKLKSNGMLQHEAYYNMGIEGAVVGVKVRGKDPLLYFRFRFK